MEGFLIAAFTALIVGGVYYYFKKSDNLKWLIARMIINIVLAVFFFVSMIVMLCIIDSEYRWFSFFLFIPIIVFLIFFALDGRRHISLKELEKKRMEIENKKNELRQKEIAEKERKKLQVSLIEQCGIKFFLKYYKLLVRLPIRDIELDENFTAEEKIERLTAAKAIINQGFSHSVAQHILDSYADLLTDEEKAIANEIISVN